MSLGTTSATPGQCAEISAALIKALPKAIADLDPKKVIAAARKGEELEWHLRQIFCKLTGTQDWEGSALPAYKRDMRKEGWKPLEECGRNPDLTVDTIPNLVHVPFLKKNEDYIGGEEVVIRARGELKANWSQLDAEFLLDNQHLIPASFRGKYILFTGTIWQDRDGRRLVAYLDWDGAEWYLNFYWLGGFYRSVSALPGLRK